MKMIKEEVTSACEAATKQGLTDFGEALIRWWPAALTLDLKTSVSERIKSAVNSNIDSILDIDLLGKNVFEADKILSDLGLGVEPGDGVKFSGKLAHLAIKRGGPGAICEVSADKAIDVPLPPYDKLSGNLNINVQVSSQLRSMDRTWDTKAAIKITVTGEWSWEQDFGSQATGSA